MRIGLIAMSGVRVRTRELAELGVTLPQFVNRGKVVASLPSPPVDWISVRRNTFASSCWNNAARVWQLC